ncbi:hypothetical protein [Streptomyces sp. V3I7]|nr:hypothetical protein [Streptomyces sp. V3I7]
MRGPAGGEKSARRMGVQCGCERTLRVTLDATGIRCPMASRVMV